MHIGAGASHQRYGGGGNPKAHQFLSGCPCSHFAGQTMALTTRGSYHDLEREMEFDSGNAASAIRGQARFEWITTSDSRVRWTGHLSPISNNLACCSGVRSPSRETFLSIRSRKPCL